MSLNTRDSRPVFWMVWEVGTEIGKDLAGRERGLEQGHEQDRGHEQGHEQDRGHEQG